MVTNRRDVELEVITEAGPGPAEPANAPPPAEEEPSCSAAAAPSGLAEPAEEEALGTAARAAAPAAAAAAPSGERCFICLEEGEAGAPPLGRVCGCEAARVHLACLQSYLNSERRRAMGLPERTRCPICSEPYRVLIAARQAPARPPCWALVRGRNLAVGLGLLLLCCVLMAALESRLPLAGLALLGMALASTGCLISAWSMAMPLLEATGEQKARGDNELVVRAPPGGGGAEGVRGPDEGRAVAGAGAAVVAVV